MSAKQPPAVKGSGLAGSSWLLSAEVARVQATKKPMPNPSKGVDTYHLPPGLYVAFPAKGLLNGSRIQQIHQMELLRGTSSTLHL